MTKVETYIHSDSWGAELLDSASNCISQSPTQSQKKKARLKLRLENEVRFLTAEITTPFDTLIEQADIDHYLRENFQKEKSQNIRWEVLFTHDSNLGSHHKVLLCFSDKQFETDTHDGIYPSLLLCLKDLGTMDKDFIFLKKWEDQIIYIIWQDNYLFHLSIEEYIDEDRINEKVKILQGYFKKEIKSKKDLQVYFQTTEPLDLESFGFQAWQTQEKKLSLANTLHLHKTHPSLNLADQDQLIRLQNQKEKKKVLKLFGIVILLLGLLNLPLQMRLGNQENKLEHLELKSSQFESLRKRLTQVKEEEKQIFQKAQDYRAIWKEPINWSMVFNQIYDILPNQASLTRFNLKTSSRNKTQQIALFEVKVNDWSEVRTFQEKLSDIGKTQTISNKRKNGKSSVSFQVEVTF